jgi:hypothetical protein
MQTIPLLSKKKTITDSQQKSNFHRIYIKNNNMLEVEVRRVERGMVMERIVVVGRK